MSDDEDELRALRQTKNYHSVAVAKQKQLESVEESRPDEKQSTEEDNLEFTSFGARAVTVVKDYSKDVRKKVGPQRPQPSARAEDDMIGPPRPPPAEIDEDGDYEEFSGEDTNYYKIPYSHEVQLKGHTRMVSTMCLDPSGSRLLTGSHDTNVKMWDFAGMDRGMRSFRNIVPSEGNYIKALDYTHTGDAFLCATAGWQAKLYNRDGFETGECIKGDMYLMDQTNTKGHTSNITSAAWRPKDKTQFVTCSNDATLRIWDVETIKRKQKQVVKLKSDNGKKTGATTLHCAHDASLIAVACQDGSVQLFSFKGSNSRPSLLIREAHANGNDITSVKFGADNFTLVTRSMDDTMKVWDIRKSKEPLAVFDDLPNFGEIECMFSPDDRLIVTGTSVKKGAGTGLLVFYDKSTMSRVKQIGVSSGSSVVSMLWHPKINQLAVATSESHVHIFYDPILSTKGALLSVIKKPREVDPNDFEPARPIITPHSLPMYSETPSQKRKDARASRNPMKTAKLSEGPSAPKPSTSIMPHLFATFIKKNTMREEDPRDALLRYADASEKDPKFFGAYKETQPDPIFDMTPDDGSKIAKPNNTTPL